ncbi:hypothetical protein WN51_04129 [Melipona quadrifasciata]|uniref:Uncharacterized protein n=1 Tax=Melipona quadrifasciata TaxID=166423 RepID=A0A0M8ZSD4_9HYME|nr:hypothetical protein WN51_04129 [Melipona quadrifasciata]
MTLGAQIETSAENGSMKIPLLNSSEKRTSTGYHVLSVLMYTFNDAALAKSRALGVMYIESEADRSDRTKEINLKHVISFFLDDETTLPALFNHSF